MENTTFASWMSEPNARGTFGILKSCVITLALCIYTALHLNIPRAGTTAANKYWRKTLWVLIGMFGPEMVVFFAWDQLQQAKNLSERLESIFKEQEEKAPDSKRRYKWTQVHSFYAIMGGFVVDTNIYGEDPYIPNSPQLALQEDMIYFFANMGVLPDISKESIIDKSKADSFAKTLVIAQAIWFILQTIMRWVQTLPVTTLEINTISHAICAIVVYTVWWDKPLDVQEPTVVTGEGVHQLTAFCWELSNHWQEKERQVMKKQLGFLGYGGVSESNLRETRLSSLSTRLGPIESAEVLSKLGNSLVGCLNSNSASTDFYVPFYAFQNGSFQQRVILHFNPGEYPPRSLAVTGLLQILGTEAPQGDNPRISEAPTLSRRWELILQAVPMIQKLCQQTRVAGILGISLNFLDISLCLPSSRGNKELPGDLVVLTIDKYSRMKRPQDESTNFSTWTLDRGDPTVGLLVFALCAAAYGGVHASAWNDFFPSGTERLLWQISSIYVAALSIIAVSFKAKRWLRRQVFSTDRLSNIPVVGPALAFGLRRLRWLAGRNLDGRIRNILRPLFLGSAMLLLGAAFLCYCFARAYLVVEAFIALRQQPTKVYSTPDWTQYLPHL